MDNYEIFILILSAFLTSSISAVIGMGGGVILLGIMAIIIPEGYKVIALHGMVQLFSNTIRAYIFKKHIKKILISQFLIGALIGVIISICIILILIAYYNVNSVNEIKAEFLKPFIGIFIVWNLFLKNSKKEKNINTFVPVGLIAGISSIFIGAVGPLIAPFFLSKNLTKKNIIANKAVSQMITHITKIPLFIYFFNMNYNAELKTILPLILAVYIGTNFGKKILNFIPEALFKKIFKITLLIIAVRLILSN